jgi:hypothetical protein
VFSAAMYDGLDKYSGGHFKDLENLSILNRLMNCIKPESADQVLHRKTVKSILPLTLPLKLCRLSFVRLVNLLSRGKTIKEGGSNHDFVSGLQVGIANREFHGSHRKLVFEEKE